MLIDNLRKEISQYKPVTKRMTKLSMDKGNQEISNPLKLLKMELLILINLGIKSPIILKRVL